MYCTDGWKTSWKSDRFVLGLESLDKVCNINTKLDDRYSNINYSVNQVTNNDLQDIYNFDLLVFPAKRENFLKEWLIPSDLNKVGKSRIGFISRDKKNNFKIAGFCCVRECMDGSWKCGPLYGNNSIVCAQLLFQSLKHAKENSSTNDGKLQLYIDVPLNNKVAIDLISNQFGAKRVQFCLTRMYKGIRTKTIDDKQEGNKLVFGICTVELG